MGRAAGEDERSEHPEQISEGDVAPFHHEIGERDRDDIIGQADRGIRRGVQEQKVFPPEQAKPWGVRSAELKMLRNTSVWWPLPPAARPLNSPDTKRRIDAF
jgi:hypothetical protein